MEELSKSISKIQESMEKLQPWAEQITNAVTELVNCEPNLAAAGIISEAFWVELDKDLIGAAKCL